MFTFRAHKLLEIEIFIKGTVCIKGIVWRSVFKGQYVLKGQYGDLYLRDSMY